MLMNSYVKWQLADDSENKMSFFAYFYTICPFQNTWGISLLPLSYCTYLFSDLPFYKDTIKENKK